MPNESYITGLRAVTNGKKSQCLNLSNARVKTYAQIQEMTEEQLAGVIICPDYPLEEGDYLPASRVLYDRETTVKDKIDELDGKIVDQTPETDITIGIATPVWQVSANQGFIVGVNIPFIMKNTNYVWKSCDLTMAGLGSVDKSSSLSGLYAKHNNSFYFFTDHAEATPNVVSFVYGTITLTFKAD